MDTKTLSIIKSCENKQLPILSNDTTYQIIINRVDGTIIYAESAIKSVINLRAGYPVSVFTNNYGLDGHVEAYDPKTNMLQINIDSKASKTTRRNYLRVENITKAGYKEVLNKNGELLYYAVSVSEQETSSVADYNKLIFIIDLSGGGLSFKSDVRFEKDSTFKITFDDLPEIEGIVKNVSHIKSSKQEMYRHGIQFINMSDRLREKVISKVFKIYNQKYKK